MKCTTCGTDNPANARFCGNCRQSLVEESEAGSTETETAELQTIGFPDAIKLGLRRYFDFSGRSTRSEFWWFGLFIALVGIGAMIVDGIVGATGSITVSGLVGLALIIPNVAISVRRLHDINRSGWWLLLHFGFGIGSIVLIIWHCIPSKAEAQLK